MPSLSKHTRIHTYACPWGIHEHRQRAKRVKVQGTATGAPCWLLAGLGEEANALNLLTLLGLCSTLELPMSCITFSRLFVCVCVRNVVRPCLPFAQRLTAHANSKSNNNNKSKCIIEHAESKIPFFLFRSLCLA